MSRLGFQTTCYVSHITTSWRHNSVYVCGRFILTLRWDHGTPLRVQVRHKTGEFHQIRNSEQRSPLSQKDFRIRRSDIGPLRRNGANRSVVHTQ
jgi:hypothetical protein